MTVPHMCRATYHHGRLTQNHRHSNTAAQALSCCACATVHDRSRMCHAGSLYRQMHAQTSPFAYRAAQALSCRDCAAVHDRLRTCAARHNIMADSRRAIAIHIPPLRPYPSAPRAVLPPALPIHHPLPPPLTHPHIQRERGTKRARQVVPAAPRYSLLTPLLPATPAASAARPERPAPAARPAAAR